MVADCAGWRRSRYEYTRAASLNPSGKQSDATIRELPTTGPINAHGVFFRDSIGNISNSGA